MSRAEKQTRRSDHKETRRQHPIQRQTPITDASKDADIIRLVSYEITEEPLQLDAERNHALDAALEGQHEELFELSQNKPKLAIPRLEKILQQFPDSPLLLNWLAAAYAGAGMREQYEQTVRRNYQSNPDYLFARLGCAELELRANRPEGVAEILDQKFDLKLLYPERNVFHISEFLSFAALMVEYHLRTSNISTAKIMFDIMQQIAPDHRLTKQIEEILQSPFVTLMETIEAMKEKRAQRKSRRPKIIE